MFEIVVVCTGNRNRSPIAEAALKEATQGLPVSVSSAGLLDLGEAPALPETLEVAAKIGLDISSHRSCCLVNVDLTEADLVLGLEWEHVATAVVDHRAPADRSFTLLELAELLDDFDDPEDQDPEDQDPEERARALVSLAAASKRASGRPAMGASVPDPFGGPMQGYADMAEAVRATAHRIAARLFALSRLP